METKDKSILLLRSTAMQDSEFDREPEWTSVKSH